MRRKQRQTMSEKSDNEETRDEKHAGHEWYGIAVRRGSFETVFADWG